ncbi:MAG TPA: serine hydrolase domain-containing protein [Allosphingosinicella sp.]|nr:serine hydrolase domain-containing protein [Allosphingosinicella sp.]
MTSLRVAATIMVASAQLTSAAGATRPDFADNLRRAITVSGQENVRFRLADRMAHYLVPAVSVAIIQDCRIVELRAFGTAAPGRPANSRTLFQAGSLSKTFTAVAALRLVEQGRLSLDVDVRPLLTSWRLPDSPLLEGRTVTLRGLLSHTAGINQEGGNGYVRGARLPSLREILDGSPPANTDPIRVIAAPGTAWHYSGGGYYITQALMQDVSSSDFPQLMARLVIRPLGLRDSHFSQPLDRRLEPRAATAAGPDGTPLAGGWRVNPELAAGGLWTTPGDIARLLIAIARSVRGERGGILTRQLAAQFMTRGPGNWGLGVDLGRLGSAPHFGHTGHNIGFVSEYVMYPDSCQGAVVMTNADQGGWLASEILSAIGEAYGWPNRTPPVVQAAIPLTDRISQRFVGTWRLRDFPAERFSISRRASGLYWARVGYVGRDLLPEAEGQLFSPDSRMILEAADPTAERAATLSLSFGSGRNVAERIAD